MQSRAQAVSCWLFLPQAISLESVTEIEPFIMMKMSPSQAVRAHWVSKGHEIRFDMACKSPQVPRISQYHALFVVLCHEHKNRALKYTLKLLHVHTHIIYL